MRSVYLSCVSIALCLTLGACGGNVTRHESSAAVVTPLANAQTRKATLLVHDEVKAKLAGNVKFNDAELVSMINRRLETAGALAEDAPYTVEVLITDVRVRSTFSAVMWGFMAGDDHISGTVELRNADKKPVHKFDVKASYALGGFAGGQDASRMGWLYEKFSELVVAELRGTQVATAAPGSTGTAASAQPEAPPAGNK